MLKNYIKISIRGIIRQPVYAFINIIGLAIGMACFLLITLWVKDELNFDKFHKNAKNIYRVNMEINTPGTKYDLALTPPPMSPIIKNSIPEINDATRVHFKNKVILKHNNLTFFEKKGVFVDPSFFQIFSFPFISGDQQHPLADPHNIVISQKMAIKYFKKENPLGKIIEIDGVPLIVTGVLKDIPQNSHIQFEFACSILLTEKTGSDLNNWGDVYLYTYILINKDTNPEKIAEKINNTAKNFREELFLLQPLNSIHTTSGIEAEFAKITDKKYIYIFSLVSFLILLIACINYLNLTNAKSFRRVKESTIRKSVGANKRQLIMQFIFDTLFIAIISYFFALIIVEFSLPYFNQLADKKIDIHYLNRDSLLFLFLVILFAGIIPGIAPAISYSSIRPILSNENYFFHFKKLNYRIFLVLFQFSLSIILIICAILINNQINFLANKNLGFDKDNIIYIDMEGDVGKNYKVFKDELLKNPDIIGVTAKNSLPNEIADKTNEISWEGKTADDDFLIEGTGVDPDYIKTMKLNIIEGRDFNNSISEIFNSFILNENAISRIGYESPVGKNINIWGFDGTIVGIYKDAHFRSLKYPYEPQLLFIIPDFANSDYISNGVILIRLDENNRNRTISFIEKTWTKIIKDVPFEFGFLDEQYNNLYKTEYTAKKLVSNFAFLAIVISCLGLFGLTLFNTERRIKEIGIRKANGAETKEIMLMLSKDFTKWVVLAFIIACPIAYFIMHKWLQNFAYRTNLNWWIFALAGLFAMIIALLTVSWQSWRAARRNPVEALRYE
ncbi:MAG: ABC transporter permease [Bacteroidales bacterium]|nr:ABC transporter permease [Bacteroidales bacterium]